MRRRPIGSGNGLLSRLCKVRFLGVSPNIVKKVFAKFYLLEISRISLKVCKCGSEFEVEYNNQKKCRPCKRQYDREYHARRPNDVKQRKMAKQDIRKQEGRQYVWDYLNTQCCELCGENDTIVLEFDHIDRDSKLGNVCEMYRYSIKKIIEEIQKCRVLCANCHRRHTAAQMGWYKGLI